MFSDPSVITFVLGAQKNRLIETVLLSTHNICFCPEIRKLDFCYALLTKVLSGTLDFTLGGHQSTEFLSLCILGNIACFFVVC